MTRKFLHESLYRGEQDFGKLATPKITVCGAGALGSHLIDNLARQGFKHLKVIDYDRIEEHNVSTQLYGVCDVGAKKVEVLRNRLFRSTEVELEIVEKRLIDRNARSFLKGSDIVIDTFDNSQSRQLIQYQCRQSKLQCLHVGLNADYAEVIWDQQYQVPNDVGEDVCEYPLARNLILLAVAIASEELVRFILTGKQANRSMTLADFSVQAVEPSV